MPLRYRLSADAYELMKTRAKLPNLLLYYLMMKNDLQMRFSRFNFNIDANETRNVFSIFTDLNYSFRFSGNCWLLMMMNVFICFGVGVEFFCSVGENSPKIPTLT